MPRAIPAISAYLKKRKKVGKECDATDILKLV
jgi:hypothetical protein